MAGVVRQSITVPIPEDISLYQFVSRNFAANADRPAVTDGITGKTYKYKELDRLIKCFASALVKKGVKKGDVVAIISSNCIDWAVVYYGVLAIGGIVTTCNHMYTENEFNHQLKDSGAQYLVAEESCIPTINKLDITFKEKFVFGVAEGYISYVDMISDSGDQFPTNVQINPKKDICILPYSSGTTGVAKGVMLSHYNLVACLQQGHHEAVKPEDLKRVPVLAVLPFYHAFGMIILLASGLRDGAQIVTLPRFEPNSFLKAIQDCKVRHIGIVPPLALFLLKSPLVDKYDLSSLTDIGCGAAPLGGEIMNAIIAKFNLKRFNQGYGMTESCGILTLPFECNKYKIGSVGTPIPNTELKFVDLNTKEVLPVNKDGELWARGPQIMMGYLNRPEETANCLDSDGWLRTGDVGHYDEEGHIFIVERLKELIKYKGFQVPPAELEALLKCHEDIADAAVIGIDDEEAGEVPRAIVIKKNPEGDLTEKMVQDYVAANVAPHKKLRGGVEFVTQIPKSASGKILRRIIKEQYVASLRK
ncbi:uncharacterized protein TRIADDRAFT_29779 [Trichoplax adhaerens]|uniref:Luciferin 4-monooxygenase n=1 Tax=Trichoplax adhaerens TaxID=10228 RepID=B3S5F9_TRIAD|nr:hypothetical protein TRIADDRAFT_29779 [Trichoplax adhaerens]EDV22035.1 hypothetical protein TRIADDRAFT_29779 [Trichoplax adhaerens]|eukprot:XP_002115672.1 hypothetical protein TRIADDRAFT_29779 [Trichoplax adhaerens]